MAIEANCCSITLIASRQGSYSPDRLLFGYSVCVIHGIMVKWFIQSQWLFCLVVISSQTTFTIHRHYIHLDTVYLHTVHLHTTYNYTSTYTYTQTLHNNQTTLIN